MKVCSKCKIDKDESEFHKGRNRKKEVILRQPCSVCRSNPRCVSVFKDCKKCNIKKHKREFGGSVNKHGTFVLRPECKVCYAENQRLWVKENPIKVKVTNKNSKKKNYQKAAKTRNIYRSKNKERIISQQTKANRERIDGLKLPYLVGQIKKQGLPKEIIDQYPILIELKKMQILNHRLIKSLKNDNENS